MNVEWFTRPIAELSEGFPPGLAGADFAAAWLVLVLVQGKFWLLFALLFGAGFAVMQARAEAAGTRFLAPYLRRVLMLGAFGVAHALLLWTGDILHTYALAAVGLLLFARADPLARGVAGGLLFALVTAWIGAAVAWYVIDPAVGGAAPLADSQIATEAARATAIYRDGDFAAATAQRAREFADLLAADVFLVPVALSVFLIGSALLATGPLSRPDAHRRFHRVAAFGLFPVGLAATVWAATLATGTSAPPTDAEMLAKMLAWLGAPLMAIGYLGAVALASLRPRAGAWLRRWFAPAGRMALTNYLAMSLILALVFNGYGLGLYGQVPRAAQVGLVLVVVAAQMVASRWWLARFRYGPLEWAWRAFTWWRWPPLRREPVGSGAVVP